MSNSSSEDGSSEEEEIQVESLVSGRERRANAGNRMATLLATEEPADAPGEEEDDLKLLFQETGEEEDAEFASGDDAVSDVEMDSSSSEDEGKEDDEEAGEKEIERQAKEERKRKRKALEMFGTSKKRKTTGITKQVTIAVPSEPRPKKKSERVSWLPVQEEGPVRASSRMQTMQNKQIVHERMKETEKRRKQQLKIMNAAAKRKEAGKAKALTQEDRLAEAARVEAKNAKTLNRWEATERRRVEEQRAKLAALKNRGLKGSVVSVWSGPSQWVDGKCVAVGGKTLDDDKKTDGKKGNIVSASKVKTKLKGTQEPAYVNSSSASVPPAITLSVTIVLQDLNGAWNSTAPGNPFYTHPEEGHSNPTQDTATTSNTSPKEPRVAEIQSRTLVHLDAAALREPSLQDSVLLRGRKSSIKIHGKLPEKEKCFVTGLHARYRDPKTGVPYANIAAFKQLRIKDAAGGYTSGRWSTLLGQYVGSDMDAPNAVPEILRGNV